MDKLMHCDLVAILQGGRVVAVGSPREIMALGERLDERAQRVTGRSSIAYPVHYSG
jgi:hypothetical protein